MRRFTVLAALAVVAIALTTSAAAVSGPVGADYATYRPDCPKGILTLHNAEGRRYEAFDVYGAPLLQGSATGSTFDVLCPNRGTDDVGDLVRIHVEPDIWLSVGSDSEDFHWE